MASNEDTEETATRGNDWEVVSLTASAYAAAASAPGSKQEDANDEHKDSGKYEAETSSALFMSGHFVYPPSQHENLPLEQENNEILTENVVKEAEYVSAEGSMTDVKNEEHLKSKGLSSPELSGIQIFDENGNQLSISDAEFEGDAVLQGLNLVDKEPSLYSAAAYSSLHSEEHMLGSMVLDESSASNDPFELLQQISDSDISNSPKAMDENKPDGDGLPCQAWWKRHTNSLIAHAKEANTFWSIFIATAVMGLVILGQCWQHERLHVLQLKWQLGVHNERMSRMLGPLSRLKDVIVGSECRGSFIRGSTPAQR
ncbi:PREDICTED: ATG8-interacting protein 2-like [Ipomoea nil]|uniref:ATG8-interacting protein 2-like n=1 Tax=Ipomoea nil TaxID=35883 RepID=UPI000901A4A4|nr:PREDICTED: ATG8-interacting protein 2-like [Ipomoea nil]XP_019181757.1 PREDICTED: ATG8-interacting protein 2-like [Ipomoea nil]